MGGAFPWDDSKRLQSSNKTLLNPEYRAEQFPKDVYESVVVLFCNFCQLNVNWKSVDICKDILRSME